MKQAKIVYSVNIPITYVEQFDEQDYEAPIREVVRKRKSKEGLQDIADEIYHLYREELLSLIIDNIKVDEVYIEEVEE